MFIEQSNKDKYFSVQNSSWPNNSLVPNLKILDLNQAYIKTINISPCIIYFKVFLNFTFKLSELLIFFHLENYLKIASLNFYLNNTLN